MSAYLSLTGLSLQTPDTSPLFSDLTVNIGREAVGLVGRNGAGKSTLLAAIRGAVKPAAGQIIIHGSVGVLAQTLDQTGTVSDVLGVSDGLACLQRIEDGAASLEDMSSADWTLPERASEAMREVGLSPDQLSQPAETLSGGERTRLGIARLWLQQPDILLLDEPTNNLDAEGRAAIHRLIRRWKGAVVIASHDRDILEQVDRIVHLSSIGASVFTGGWSAFAEAKAQERALAEKAQDDAERHVSATRLAARKQEERKARRDRMGRKKRAERSDPKILLDARKERAEGTTGRDAGIAARQTQKAQEALLEARQKVEILTPVSITLPDVSPVTGKQILRVSNLTIRIEGRALFQPVSFSLFGADRLAISGPNGVGKSSLLKAVLDEVNTFEGQIERFGSQFSYLDQHVSLLDTDLSLIDNLRRHCPHLNDNQAHAALARFGFRNSDAEKPVFVLSGGERMRAGLACVLSKAVLPDLLILDEPTNHLDLDTLETLETALKGFGGSLLLVSHDLHFIRAIGCENSIELKQTGAEQI